MEKNLLIFGDVETLDLTTVEADMKAAGVPDAVISKVVERLTIAREQAACTDPGTCDDPRCTCTACSKAKATPEVHTGCNGGEADDFCSCIGCAEERSRKGGVRTMCADCSDIYDVKELHVMENMVMEGLRKLVCPECLKKYTDAEKDKCSKLDNQMGSVLREAEKIINGERQDMYGSPEDSFQFIADLWNSYIHNNCYDSETGAYLGIEPSDVVQLMILLKIARQANKPKRDNIVDIAGYAGILERFLDE